MPTPLRDAGGRFVSRGSGTSALPLGAPRAGSGLTLSATQPNVLAAVQRLRLSVEGKIGVIMDATGAQTVAYLRSKTNEMQPPAKPGGGMRPAHPGHWADVTGRLALSYGYRVVTGPGYAVLAIYNSAPYAVFLELRDGYYVVSGVTMPGGPVDVALRMAVQTLAPEWKFVSYAGQQMGAMSQLRAKSQGKVSATLAKRSAHAARGGTR